MGTWAPCCELNVDVKGDFSPCCIFSLTPAFSLLFSLTISLSLVNKPVYREVCQFRATVAVPDKRNPENHTVTAERENSFLHVECLQRWAIHPGRVQYPVPQQMTPLGPEILEAAETEEEKKALPIPRLPESRAFKVLGASVLLA